MARLKGCIANTMSSLLPLPVLERRHHLRTRLAVKEWLKDDYFFIHIPKSGGTSVAEAHNRKESGHYTYKKLCRMRNNDDFKGVYFIMRNPIDRIISSYKYLLTLHQKFGSSPVPSANRSKNIDDFLESYLFKIDVERHYFFKSASAFIDGAPRDATWAINFSGLGSNLRTFYDCVTGIEKQIPHSNASHVVKGSVDISKRNMDRLMELYSKDIQLYNSISDMPFVKLADVPLTVE